MREDMQQRIDHFAGQVVTDLAAAMAGVMTNLGYKLGLTGYGREWSHQFG
jgi:hypothetical protein